MFHATSNSSFLTFQECASSFSPYEAVFHRSFEDDSEYRDEIIQKISNVLHDSDDNNEDNNEINKVMDTDEGSHVSINNLSSDEIFPVECNDSRSNDVFSTSNIGERVTQYRKDPIFSEKSETTSSQDKVYVNLINNNEDR